MSHDILRALGESDVPIENARSEFKQVRAIYERAIQYGTFKESLQGLDFKRLSLKRLPVWQHKLLLAFEGRKYNVVLESTPAPSLMLARIDIFVESDYGDNHSAELEPVSSIRSDGYGRIGTLTAEQAMYKLESLKSLTTALERWLEHPQP